MKNYLCTTLLLTFIVFTSCKKQGDEEKNESAKLKQEEKFVSTPFGMMDASKVHYVEPENEIAIIQGKIKKINSETGAIIADYGSYIQMVTRGGSSGGKISNVNATSVTTPLLAGTLGNGYLATYDIPAGKAIQSFSTSFVVPNNPTAFTSDQTFFLWNGLMSQSGMTFMQPVLEWGNSAGDRYAIRNWVAVNDEYFYGKLVNVNPGTTLTGVMTLISAAPNAYKYKVSFTGYPAADYTATFPEPATQLQECFETYIFNQTYLPPNTKATMKSIKLLYKGSTVNQPITWKIETPANNPVVTTSGKNTVLVNNSGTNTQVDFYFH